MVSVGGLTAPEFLVEGPWRCATSFGLLPLPKLKDPVPLCIDPKANYGELLCEGLLKMLAIPGLNVKDAFLIRR